MVVKRTFQFALYTYRKDRVIEVNVLISSALVASNRKPKAQRE